MKVLVTGAAGFVGRHLVEELRRAGHDVILTGLIAGPVPGLGDVLSLDITNHNACIEKISAMDPEAVIHLAGLAHTVNSDSNLPALFDVNVAGAANISKAMASLARQNPSRRYSLLFVSSAFVYGGNHTNGKLECSESTPLSPRTKYGESKVLAEQSVSFFARDNFSVYIARPFNHVGPGQDPSFVVPGFISRVRNATAGGDIETGNLDSYRDFTDVRDIVRGYRLIIEKQPNEKIFVFGSGQPVTVQSVLDQIVTISGKQIKPRINPNLVRPAETSILVANPELVKKKLDWIPEISLQQSLHDIWDDVTS